MVNYNYYFAVGIALLSVFSIVASKQWFAAGFRIFIGNLRFKGNAGAIFLRTVGSDFAPPIIVDLRKTEWSDKKRQLIYNRDMFKEGRFMGTPFCFLDAEDAKTSLGLAKQQTDEQGNPLSTVLQVGDQNIVQPITVYVKSSVSIAPELTKSVINAIALSQTVKDFLEKNKILLLVAGAAVLVGVISAYFGYVNNGLIDQTCRVGINQLSGQITAMGLNLTGVA